MLKLKLSPQAPPPIASPLSFLSTPHYSPFPTPCPKAACNMAEVNGDAPSLSEITALIVSELTSKQDDDEIEQCGRPALEIVQKDPDMCMRLAYQKLHDVPYKEVGRCWRRLYTDAVLWKVVAVLRGRVGRGVDKEVEWEVEEEMEEGSTRETRNKDWITEVAKALDMALILTGAPLREELVELVFSALQHHISTFAHERKAVTERPSKRRKVDPEFCSPTAQCIPETFPAAIADPPRLKCPISRHLELGLSAFQRHISNTEIQPPIIIEGAINHWPALDERPWNRPSYLLERTLGGRRLVPVEIGRSYTDSGWGQKILTFGSFVKEYMLRTPSLIPNPESTANANTQQTGYLAQHDLFTQIPSLRSDICIPDYCYATPPPSDLTKTKTKEVGKLEDPLLNAWFGPAGTISPLHTDPYHNILAQVVGYKYVRLYAPSEVDKLHPRGTDEMGVDMSNTSSIDFHEFIAMHPECSPWESMSTESKHGEKEAWETRFPGFKDAKYVEGVLGPGDCLYIPVGWWHYIQSLTPSFSVSFWFN
jgi:hypothetical protein